MTVRSKSSQKWLQEHHRDRYVKRAQEDGYRSRASYKLIELNQKDSVFKAGSIVVDLGAAPGGWSQVAIKLVGSKGKVIASDILSMNPIDDVNFILGDFTDSIVLQNILDSLEKDLVDLVISDMAPNITGIKVVDQSAAIYLNELALDFSCNWLKPNGHLLVKSFIGADFDSFVDSMKPFFKKVLRIKPSSSRGRSSEIFVLGYGKLNT